MQQTKQYWIVKQEPEEYSWQQFVKDGGAEWVGVRNFQARNNLRLMKRGDLVFYYHSGEAREIVGVAKVSREHYPDPTASEGDWSAVKLTPAKILGKPVSLEQIKTDEDLKNILLVRQSRLSVSPLTQGEFERVLELAETQP